jgi:hypothetical protein
MIKTGKKMRNVNETTHRDSAIPWPIRVPFRGQGKKSEVTWFIIAGWLFLMSSCHVSEEERQKCRLISANTVTALITDTTCHSAVYGELSLNDFYYNDGASYTFYLEVAGMKFQYFTEEVCSLKKDGNRLGEGDSVWLYLDWRGKYFVADTPDIQQAVDEYVYRYKESHDGITIVYAMAAYFSVIGLMVWLFGLIERLQDNRKKRMAHDPPKIKVEKTRIKSGNNRYPPGGSS